MMDVEGVLSAFCSNGATHCLFDRFVRGLRHPKKRLPLMRKLQYFYFDGLIQLVAS
jgi:hypothetical protein